MIRDVTPQMVWAGFVATLMALLVGPELSRAMWPAVIDIASPIPGLALDGIVGGETLALVEASILTIPVIAIIVGLPMGTVGIFLLVYRRLME